MNKRKFGILFFGALTLLQNASFANEVRRPTHPNCIKSGELSICKHDIIYKAGDYPKGGIVETVNSYHNTVSVRGFAPLGVSNNVYEENPSELDVTKGCLDDICVGDLVYKGNDYKGGARVLGLNPNHRTVTVQSMTGNMGIYKERMIEMDIPSGCLDGVCVGDIIMKGNDYRNGGRVLAINFHALSVTVRSHNFRPYPEDPRNLSVINLSNEYDDQARKESMR